MKKINILFLLVLFNLSFLFSIEVYEKELEAKDNKEIIFVNYEGPHKVIDTFNQIKGIGADLASSLKDDTKASTLTDKYEILHLVENVENKLDADVFIIKKAAQVDHIKNLRNIIAGYLSTMYSYAFEDAYLLAEFITYYNAVYRTDIPYFGEKYNETVMENVDESNVGLSVLYTNWPGKTAIIIPLKEPGLNGDLSAIDPDIISDDKVIEDLRSQDDLGLDSRKGMVEFKEKEIDENLQDIEAKETTLEKEKAELADKEQALKKEQEDAQASGDSTESKKVSSVMDEIEKEKAKIAKEEAALKSEKETEEQRLAAVQKDRDKIVYDEKKKLKLEVSPEEEMKALATKMLPFFIFSEKAKVGNFYMPSVINKETGKIVKKGKINSIRSSEYIKTNEGVIVIAGESGNNRAVKLLLLDSETFEVLKESDDSLYENSPFIIENTSMYVIVEKNKNWYLAKYKQDLSVDVISENPVLPDTALYFEGNLIYLQGADEKILILNNKDLKVK